MPTSIITTTNTPNQIGLTPISTSSAVSPDSVTKLANTRAPKTMAKIIAVVDAVSFRHSSIVMMPILRRAIAINNAPVAPMPAHSVAVNTPPHRPRITSPNSSSVDHTPLSDAMR